MVPTVSDLERHCALLPREPIHDLEEAGWSVVGGHDPDLVTQMSVGRPSSHHFPLAVREVLARQVPPGCRGSLDLLVFLFESPLAPGLTARADALHDRPQRLHDRCVPPVPEPFLRLPRRRAHALQQVHPVATVASPTQPIHVLHRGRRLASGRGRGQREDQVVDAQDALDEGQRVLALDPVVVQSEGVVQLFPREDKNLQGGGEALLVVELLLDEQDGVRALDLRGAFACCVACVRTG